MEILQGSGVFFGLYILLYGYMLTVDHLADKIEKHLNGGD